MAGLNIGIPNEPFKGEPLRFSERQDLYHCKKYKNSSIISQAENNPHLEFLKKWYQMGEDQRYVEGHDPLQFIQECTFNGKICSKQYLNNFSNLRYGNCVTFNKKSNVVKLLKSSKTGFENGLILTLYIEQHFYMASTSTIGASIIIHDPDDIPTPEEKGYILAPGYETVIGIKQTILKRLPAPYQDQCVDYKARSEEFTRSKDECIRKCIHMRSLVQCGCIDPTLGVMSDFKPCDLSNNTESCCLDDVLEYMSQIGPTCNCPLPCRSVLYGEELSKSPLRSVNPDEFLRPPNYDLVRVKIFYSTLEKHVYEQRPRWEIWEFLSILGNEFGLWLGSSLAVFVEIFDRLLLFAKHAFAYFFFSFKRKIAS
ncbi:Degenerin mec-10 [Araneus ventricosus]|uniref:Degenerin mec-10 n=1 Tax=Araneus ventricosus TaxID=182803 RepID=A0A4Y2PF43_ARAVE|nr:Degenerin mec-10 [Araneus ventricosus]